MSCQVCDGADKAWANLEPKLVTPEARSFVKLELDLIKEKHPAHTPITELREAYP